MTRHVFALAMLGACTSDTDPTDTATDDVVNADIIEACAGSVDDDVPEFFKRYFRCSNISMDGDTVVINTDNLPPHPSYYYGEGHELFAEFDYDRGDEYRPNSNSLGEEDITVRIPVTPTAKGLTVTSDMVDLQMGTNNEELSGGTVGVAVDGVSLFSSMARAGDDIEAEKYTFDSYEGHPAGATYHYHTETPGPLEVLAYLGYTDSVEPGSADMELYGMLCDGTVALGCTEIDGDSPDTGDFDAQNGHTHDLTGDDGELLLEGRYHVHVCVDTFTDHLYMPEIQYYDSCDVSSSGGGPG